MEPAPDYVVASGSLPPSVPSDFYAQVARIGEEKGTKTIVDVSGKALKEALEEGVFLIKPNVREFRELVGEEIKENGPQHRRIANVDGSCAARFGHAIRLRPTRSQTPNSGEESHPPGGNPGERFCQVKPNKINNKWRVHGNRMHTQLCNKSILLT